MQRPQHKDKGQRITVLPRGASRGLAVIYSSPPQPLILPKARLPHLIRRLKRKVQTIINTKVHPRNYQDPIFTKNPNSRKSGSLTLMSEHENFKTADVLTEAKSPGEDSQCYDNDTLMLAIPSLLDYSLQLGRGLCSAGGLTRPRMLVQTAAKDQRG